MPPSYSASVTVALARYARAIRRIEIGERKFLVTFANKPTD
jgi:hypothetical protein